MQPIGFDNVTSSLCLDAGALTYEEAVAQWKTLAQAQYPERVPLYIQEMRERAYNRAGITKEVLAVALWEAQFEGKTTEAQAIQQKRLAIKAAITS